MTTNITTMKINENRKRQKQDALKQAINTPLFAGYEFPPEMTVTVTGEGCVYRETVSVPAVTHAGGRRDTLYMEASIPVTPGMIGAGQRMIYIPEASLIALYRAMAEKAPKSSADREIAELNGIIDQLRVTNRELADRLVAPAGVVTQLDTEARHWRKKFEDAQSTIDTMCGCADRLETARLAEQSLRYIAEHERDCLRAQLAAFTPPAASGLPDPPRRPDGTLAPQPKPWSAPVSDGDRRRIGG